jgi:hypothetical protein
VNGSAVVDSGAPEAPRAPEAPDGGAPPAALSCITTHYAATAVEEAPGRWALRLPDGTVVPYDDGVRKNTEQRIESPDVEDVFALPYPRGPIAAVTDPEQDPGRIRIEPLFRATYGEDAKAVERALVPMTFIGHPIRFHSRAATALARVAARLAALLRSDPSLARYFRTLGGTFASRPIAGTQRTSAHAWGIAIDIDTSQSDYWRSSLSKGGVVWRNRIPEAIVDAFESEGFVWGGRWFHYDTMHFEYRPELFDARCRTGR